jgi:TolA-binding protein
MNKTIFILVLFASSIISSCGQNKLDNSSRVDWWHENSFNIDLGKPTPPPPLERDNICKDLTLSKIASLLQSNYGNIERVGDLHSCIYNFKINSNEVNKIDEIIKIFADTNDDKIHEIILECLNNNKQLIQENQKILDLYKYIGSGNNITLVNLAIRGLSSTNKTDEVLKIYNSQKDVELQRIILKANSLTKNDDKLLKLYKSIAIGNNKLLAPIALNKLMEIEGSEKWTNWQWSNDISKILAESVDKDFYKLSEFSDDYIKLLNLAQRYPNSLFTKACKEYSSFTGVNYFGDRNNGGLRGKTNPKEEISFWLNFLRKYQDHPGSDDVMYRIARVYELTGDYENAIIWNYKATQAPDGDKRDNAQERIIFNIDLVWSSDLVNNFINKYPTHSLIPYLLYSRGVHYLRENKYKLASDDLTFFLKKYKDSRLEKPLFNKYDNNLYLDYEFWSKVEQQNKYAKELMIISNQPMSDTTLYEEAALWFNNNNLAYNNLWQGSERDALEKFIPEKWEGDNNSIKEYITYKTFKMAHEGYKRQNRHLKSISIFEKLIRDYPNSKMLSRAKYSIGLNYYYLALYGYSIPIELETSWDKVVIKSYKEFIEQFPNSSMADDALLVIASMSNKQDAISIYEKQLREYPNGDRYDDAQRILSKLKK